jgi:mono/diheme cytochrome c family protein
MVGHPSPTHRLLATGRRLAGAGLVAIIATVPQIARGDDPHADGRAYDIATSGERIYKEQCARCHGKAGEGSEDCPRKLAGDKSVGQLAKLIARTMPEDDPGTCTGADAEAAAAYIYDAFYSRTAQARNAPARVELARLTVRQYRNAVADLIGSFREAPKPDDHRGLPGEYSKSRRNRGGTPALARVDPGVRFDWKLSSPDPEKVPPKEFSARWQGSVFAPETGEYEFIVRSENSARLWVNNQKTMLIDAWVRSGKDTEHRGSIRLLGGRWYSIRLEFAKGKDGSKDKKDPKEKEPEEPASIELAWKPPQGAVETIPARDLSPGKTSEAFVLETPFPPDDRSLGYERGTSVSKAWDSATTDAAIEVGDYVVDHLRELSGVGDGDADRGKKLQEFALKLAERAFRRPLSDDEKKAFIERQFARAKTPEEGVKRVALLALKSPRFLYREIGGAADAYAVASRISFGLWDSIPDQALLDAARSGGLKTREQVAKQAERMLADPRARAKFRDFLFQWLKVDGFPELSKDRKVFPDFDASVAADLRTSLDLLVDDVAWGESADFRRLLTTDEVYFNGRLARFYGVDLPADAPFAKLKREKERAGVLTHPYLLATFAYNASSSPIHRGVLIARSGLGRVLRPPPEAVAPLAAELHAGLTTRQRVALQTEPPACQSCHAMINPLGFTLEHYDAIGRFREQESGKPIDATGSYQTRGGGTVTLRGARELAEFLAASEEVHEAFVEKLFHQVVQQPVRAYGPEKLAGLRQSFASSGFRVRKLVVEIIAETAVGPGPSQSRPSVAMAPRPAAAAAPTPRPPAAPRREVAPEEQFVRPEPER